MYNDTPYNILASYAYLGNNKPFADKLFSLSKDRAINVMIDSGAFTQFNAKVKRPYINVDDYCTFLDKCAQYAEKYVMLDVVGHAEKSRANYEAMVSRGFNPMWVATMYDNDFEYIEHCIDNNPNICVAGGATTKSEWMTQRFQMVYNKTNHKARIHGLAYVTIPKMFQLPIASVDSASWCISSSVYGLINVFRKGKGIHSTWYKDMFEKGSVTKEYQELFDRIGVSYKMFIDKDNHRGKSSISELASIYSHVQMQIYCKKNNRDYFLAVSNKSSIDKIMWVIENRTHLSYEIFKKTF